MQPRPVRRVHVQQFEMLGLSRFLRELQGDIAPSRPFVIDTMDQVLAEHHQIARFSLERDARQLVALDTEQPAAGVRPLLVERIKQFSERLEV